MAKHFHEFRDPIHTFIEVSSDEREIIRTGPFQRLRDVSQLAMTYLVYPTTTHKRFEHSLGVMHLASRIFDTITKPENVRDPVRDFLPAPDVVQYWRKVVRSSALLHDIGHLPFSHAAEAELLPSGFDHERITSNLISGDEVSTALNRCFPPISVGHVKKTAIGPKKSDENFTPLEALMAELIVGDSFGADRMDYLLRDAYHAGVPFGRFDVDRLLSTIRILPKTYEQTDEPWLGVEIGGIESAVGLALARYFMYKQVYLHPIRRIYDIHLKEFLQSWLDGGRFPIENDGHQAISDSDILVAMKKSLNGKSSGWQAADRIVNRRHFKLIYEKGATDSDINPDADLVIFASCQAKFGVENVRHDAYVQKQSSVEFPVLLYDGRTDSSLNVSESLKQVPLVSVGFVFGVPEKADEMKQWVNANRDGLLKGEMLHAE